MPSEESSAGVNQPRCPRCGKFCGEAYTYAGSAGQIAVESCVSCGHNPPNCSYEDGSCYGCQRTATHQGPREGRNRSIPWCEDHAPESAEPYPYVEAET